MYVYMLRLLNKKNEIEYYVGITNNIQRRLVEHMNGTGGRYTKGRKVLRLVWLAEVNCRSDALVVEGFLKRPENRRLKYMLLGLMNWTDGLRRRWEELKSEYNVKEVRIDG